jgi:type I restriction enzyme S subunit
MNDQVQAKKRCFQYHTSPVSRQGAKKNVTMFEAESNVNHKLCHAGDLVINTMWAWMAALGVAKQNGMVSPSYAVYRPISSKIFADGYIDHLLRTESYATEYLCRSTGIHSSRLRLYPEEFLEIPIICPPCSEQLQMLAFLDFEDRHIRRYIRAKQKLIKLLEEQKQVIIHQAVTRGLDPSVPLKPSGVEWIGGDIPAHWAVRQLKTLCSMQSGDAITSTSIELTGDYPVYGGNGVRGYASGYTHDGNFVLIGRQGALCGNVHIAQGRFWASEHAVVASLKPTHVLEWFGAILTVMNLNQYSIAAAQPGLSVGRVLNLWLPVPPQQEQSSIAEYIKRETIDIIKVIERTSCEVSLLKEYRNRLISDVITGKLDVRGLELPVTSNEAAELDDWSEGDLPEMEEMMAAEEVADEAD